MRVGVHLPLCHEFPSVLDPGSADHAGCDLRRMLCVLGGVRKLGYWPVAVSRLDPGSVLGGVHSIPAVRATRSSSKKQVMDATPEDLKTWPTNLYSQIAIALTGAELREPGLANLAARLAVRVGRKPIEAPLALPPRGCRKESAFAGNVTALIGLARLTILGSDRPLSLYSGSEDRQHTIKESSRKSVAGPAWGDATAGAVPGDEVETLQAAGAIPRGLARVAASV
eukprot:2733398-Prymnesium_polylepis.1